jgi:hypothetical protein
MSYSDIYSVRFSSNLIDDSSKEPSGGYSSQYSSKVTKKNMIHVKDYN